MAINLKVYPDGECLKDDILGQIKKQKLKKGDRILPEEKLAELYGLGIKTVRNVLSELETERIIYRKKRVGTFVNMNLKKRTNIAVLLFDFLDITNAYCREIFRGINDTLEPAEHSIQVYPIQNRRIKGSDNNLLKNLVYSGEIDGLLILSWLDISEIHELIKNSIPFVISGFEYKPLDTPNVVSDIESAFNKMINYLVSQGHKDIALISGRLDVPGDDILMAEEKLDTVYQKNSRIDSLNSCILKRGIYTVEDGKRLMEELLSNSKQVPSAVISHGDALTKGAMETIAKKGLQPGKDILLIGYVEDTNGIPRPLIKNPVYEVGKKSTEMLLEQIHSGSVKINKELVEPEFIFI